jgi:hypothetical protein
MIPAASELTCRARAAARIEPRTMLDAPPYHEPHSALGYQDAMHLTQRGRAIRKELEP